MLENLVMLVFASIFYLRTASPLSVTLVVIVIEIIESFTIDCSVIVGSACWNAPWMRHTWDNEAKSGLHFGLCRLGVMELWTAVKLEFYKMKESCFLYCHVTVNNIYIYHIWSMGDSLVGIESLCTFFT